MRENETKRERELKRDSERERECVCDMLIIIIAFNIGHVQVAEGDKNKYFIM